MAPSEQSSQESLGLTELQSRFLDLFLPEDSQRCHILVAPTGLGKTRVGAQIAAALLGGNSEARGLIVTRRALFDQWVSLLSELAPAVAAHAIDRELFRSLQVAKTEGGAAFWPLGAAVIAPDTAARGEIADELSASSWQLVVVDEADMLLRENGTLLRRLQGSASVERLLLVTARLDNALPEAFPDSQTTDWTQAFSGLMRTWLSPKWRQRRALVKYQRTKDELRFLECLTAFANQAEALNGRACTSMGYDVLFRQASSSILAFDERWGSLGMRFTDSASRVDHTWEAPEWFLQPGGLVTPPEGLPFSRNKEMDRLAMEVTLALQEVEGDAKLAALRTVLKQMGSGQRARRVCVLTAFQTTAEYLQYADLAQANGRCRVVTGALALQKRAREINSYVVEGGILVGTDAALGESSLEGTDALIHYDLPISREQMQTRLSHFWGSSDAAPPSEYAFRDESQAIALEESLLRLHRWNLASLNSQDLL